MQTTTLIAELTDPQSSNDFSFCSHRMIRTTIIRAEIKNTHQYWFRPGILFCGACHQHNDDESPSMLQRHDARTMAVVYYAMDSDFSTFCL
jgi:hypothetical protein